jgi:hypothetical protein
MKEGKEERRARAVPSQGCTAELREGNTPVFCFLKTSRKASIKKKN